MINGHPVIEHETVTFPFGIGMIDLLQVIQNTTFEMVDIFESFCSR